MDRTTGLVGVVASDNREMEGISNTAQRYENKSKEGVHDPDERKESRKIKGEKKENKSW